jgi:hypothetical protein
MTESVLSLDVVAMSWGTTMCNLHHKLGISTTIFHHLRHTLVNNMGTSCGGVRETVNENLVYDLKFQLASARESMNRPGV